MIRITTKYRDNTQPKVLRIRWFRGALIVTFATFQMLVGTVLANVVPPSEGYTGCTCVPHKAGSGSGGPIIVKG